MLNIHVMRYYVIILQQWQNVLKVVFVSPQFTWGVAEEEEGGGGGEEGEEEEVVDQDVKTPLQFFDIHNNIMITSLSLFEQAL